MLFSSSSFFSIYNWLNWFMIPVHPCNQVCQRAFYFALKVFNVLPHHFQQCEEKKPISGKGKSWKASSSIFLMMLLHPVLHRFLLTISWPQLQWKRAVGASRQKCCWHSVKRKLWHQRYQLCNKVMVGSLWHCGSCVTYVNITVYYYCQW